MNVDKYIEQKVLKEIVGTVATTGGRMVFSKLLQQRLKECDNIEDIEKKKECYELVEKISKIGFSRTTYVNEIKDLQSQLQNCEDEECKKNIRKKIREFKKILYSMDGIK